MVVGCVHDGLQGLQWWFDQMDWILNLGADGWKLDGTVRARDARLEGGGGRSAVRIPARLMRVAPVGRSPLASLPRRPAQDPFVWFLFERAYGYAGRVRKATYSELFYRTIHDHSRLRNPEALSLSRPMDGANPGMKRIPRLFFTPQDVRRTAPALGACTASPHHAC